jgi:hypothetical protein
MRPFEIDTLGPARDNTFDTYEQFASWFVVGMGPTVDIEDREHDVVCGLPRAAANDIVAARDAFLDRVRAIVNEALAARKAEADGAAKGPTP